MYRARPPPAKEKKTRGGLLTFFFFVEIGIFSCGQAKVRTLFYDEPHKMLWWSEPGAAGRGATRPRSSSLLSLRKEQPLPVTSLIQVY